MNLFYQVKNFLYTNLYISSIFGALYSILSCRNIFWKKENEENLTIYTSTILETENILSDSDDDDFEIISDEDDMD